MTEPTMTSRWSTLDRGVKRSRRGFVGDLAALLLCLCAAAPPERARAMAAPSEWTEAWRLTTSGAHIRASVAGNGRIYLLGHEVLLAVTPDNGRIDWMYESDLGVLSGVALADDTIVLAQPQGVGSLTALGARDGSQLWQVNRLGAVRSRPLIVNQTVYANVGEHQGSLIAFDLATSAERWRAALGAGTFAAAWAMGGTVFVTGVDPTTRSDVIHAIDAESGQEWWRTLPEAGLRMYGVGSDQLYATTGNGGALVAVGPSGEERWSFDARSPLVWGIDPPQEVSGVLYVATGVGQGGSAPVEPGEPGVIALDARTGALLWSTPITPFGVGSGPAIFGEMLAVSAGPVPLVVLDLATGDVLWQLSRREHSVQGIGAADGLVLVSFADALVAYRPPV